MTVRFQELSLLLRSQFAADPRSPAASPGRLFLRVAGASLREIRARGAAALYTSGEAVPIS